MSGGGGRRGRYQRRFGYGGGGHVDDGWGVQRRGGGAARDGGGWGGGAARCGGGSGGYDVGDSYGAGAARRGYVGGGFGSSGGHCSGQSSNRSAANERSSAAAVANDSCARSSADIKKKPENELNMPAVVSALAEKAGSPDEQMRLLVDLAALPAEDIAERVAICKRVEETLRKRFSKASVRPCGSSVNGLGFRGCDLNIYADIDVGPTTPASARQRMPAASASSAESGEDVAADFTVQAFSSEANVAATHDLDDVGKVDKIKAKLVAQIISTELSKSASNVEAVFTAKEAIVKFVHKATGIDCNVSFKSAIAHQTTRFIGMCMEWDERIRPLMMNIKFFCKFHGLIDNSGRNADGLTSYALMLLVIFYLQQRQPHQQGSILHSVVAFQDAMKPEGRLFIGGWERDFSPDGKRLPKLTSNKMNLPNLFQGFFRYYSEFNYSESVISPFYGAAVPKADFKGNGKPLEMDDGPAIVVQDLFELDRCVTGGAAPRRVSPKADFRRISPGGGYLKIWIRHCDAAAHTMGHVISYAKRCVYGNVQGLYERPLLTKAESKEMRKEKKRKVNQKRKDQKALEAKGMWTEAKKMQDALAMRKEEKRRWRKQQKWEVKQQRLEKQKQKAEYEKESTKQLPAAKKQGRKQEMEMKKGRRGEGKGEKDER